MQVMISQVTDHEPMHEVVMCAPSSAHPQQLCPDASSCLRCSCTSRHVPRDAVGVRHKVAKYEEAIVRALLLLLLVALPHVDAMLLLLIVVVVAGLLVQALQNPHVQPAAAYRTTSSVLVPGQAWAHCCRCCCVC